MTNKEFAQAIDKLTKPKLSVKDLANKLGVTPQKLSYWTKIKAMLEPDELSPFNLNNIEEK